jgi:hypothetical protein
MPTPVVAGERVHLVHHDRPQLTESLSAVDVDGHQHRLDRLRGREQDVRLFL